MTSSSTLFKQHPNTAVLTALGGPRRTIYAPWLNPPHPLVIETVSAAQIRRLQDRLAKSTAEEIERGRQAWARLARGIARLNAAGVRIGAGTDGGGQTGDQFVGWTMHTELENMVAAGMTPAEVLVAATRTSAEILGLDDLGMVAPGKSADFVVLDANPLDDITNTRRIADVYLRGRKVDRRSLAPSFADSGKGQPMTCRHTLLLGALHLRVDACMRGQSVVPGRADSARWAWPVVVRRPSGEWRTYGGDLGQHALLAARPNHRRRTSARWKSPGGSRPTASVRVPSSSWSRRR